MSFCMIFCAILWQRFLIFWNYCSAIANCSAGFCFIYNVPKFIRPMHSCEMILFECLKMMSEANLLWIAINWDPRITCTIWRPTGLIYCWWILFSTFQTLYCVKCHIKLCRGTLRVVSFTSFMLMLLDYNYCHGDNIFIV